MNRMKGSRECSTLYASLAMIKIVVVIIAIRCCGHEPTDRPHGIVVGGITERAHTDYVLITPALLILAERPGASFAGRFGFMRTCPVVGSFCCTVGIRLASAFYNTRTCLRPRISIAYGIYHLYGGLVSE